MTVTHQAVVRDLTSLNNFPSDSSDNFERDIQIILLPIDVVGATKQLVKRDLQPQVVHNANNELFNGDEEIMDLAETHVFRPVFYLTGSRRQRT
jgi:hypothetical protein